MPYRLLNSMYKIFNIPESYKGYNFSEGKVQDFLTRAHIADKGVIYYFSEQQ